jgi:hypothetical protein
MPRFNYEGGSSKGKKGGRSRAVVVRACVALRILKGRMLEEGVMEREEVEDGDREGGEE